MKNILKNLVDKTKETFEHASEDIREVVDAVSEDAGKLVGEAKGRLAEAEKYVKDEFTEHAGEPSDLLAKAKKAFSETGHKIKEAALEEWESATEKFGEIKDSLKGKPNDDEPSDFVPDEDEKKEG